MVSTPYKKWILPPYTTNEPSQAFDTSFPPIRSDARDGQRLEAPPIQRRHLVVLTQKNSFANQVTIQIRWFNWV